VLGLVALTGLTHVGVSGAMLGFMGVISVVAVVRCPATERRRLLMWIAGGALLLAVAGAVVFTWYDPARVLRLVKALASPRAFLSSGGMKAGAPGAPSGIGAPWPRGGPGMPPGFSLMRSAPVFMLVIGLAGLTVGWWRRARLPAADLALVSGVAAMTVLLGGPFYDFDKGIRFLLIAMVPAALTLSFLFAQLRASLWRAILALLLGGFVLFTVGIYVPRGGGPSISPAAAEELRAVAETLPADAKLLVVARHGLEWWAGWILHTHIAQPRAVKPEDWEKFDHVLYLVEKERSGFGPPMGGPPGVVPGGMGRGPREGNGGPPPGPGAGGGMPAGVFETRVPAGSVVRHEGRFFRLSDAPSPTASPTAAQIVSSARGGSD
jgi:hypothetical protein